MLAGLWAAATVCATEGVFLLGNDAQQLGRASSGVASPRSAYWSYLNPASMVDLERRIDLNWYTVFSDIEMKPRGLIGNRLDGTLVSDGIFHIGSGGIIWPLDKGVIGGGLYIPSGTGAEYPHSRNILSRVFQGDQDRQLDYQHVRLVLAYGYEFDNGWAVGVGLHGSVTRFATDHITLRLQPAQEGDGWGQALGAGFGVGLYKKWDRWAFGASYSSQHWTQKVDEYDDLLKHPLDTPQALQVGTAFQLTPKIELTADLKYLNWEAVPTYGNKLLQGGFCWRDQCGFKLGAEWKATERWAFMAGFSYMNTPVGEDHVFLAGLVPVTVEDHITAGFTYRFNERHEVHLVGIHGVANTMKDTGRGDVMSWLAKGTELTSNGESVVAGYSYKF